MNTPEKQSTTSDIQEAFRRAHFLDHVFPVEDFDAPTRAGSLEISMVAASLDQGVINEARREGMLQSVDDYSNYLEGGVKALTFDDGFNAHVVERIHQARLMRAPYN